MSSGIEPARRSYIVSVVGGKGGVGKSLVSTNLAFSFLLDTRQPTILVDADPDSYDDIGLMLGLRPTRSVIDSVKISGKIAPQLLREMAVKHQAGLAYLPMVINSADYATIESKDIDRIIDPMLASYNYIVVDCGNRFTEQNLTFLKHSTIILVVTNPDVLVLKHTKKMVETLQSMLFSLDTIKAIINRYDPSSPITPQIVQANIGIQILGAVHEDSETCNVSISKGKPALISAPKSIVARNIYQIERAMQERGILDNLYAVNKPKLDFGKKDADGKPISSAQRPTGVKGRRGFVSDRTRLKRRVHKSLVENMDLKKMDMESKDDPNKFTILYEKTKKAVLGILENEDLTFLTSRDERANLIKEILDEALALGPLEGLLADDKVSEVMVNGPDVIYIERSGKITLSDYSFSSSQQLMGVVERIMAPIGRRIDEKSPYTDARLLDGSRVHAIIPPLALDGPTLTIRKFKKEKLKLNDLVNYGSITEEIGDFLKACIHARLNILISGGTGSGKTTLLNVMSSMIPEEERIITVEDSAELQLQQDHVVRLETRPKNIEGEGEVSIRDLVKCTLRMRPDRIIVGECRSGEALDMLQAMNTGHDGSLTTIHSNTPDDAIRRLETLVMMAGMDLPAKAIREQIASAVNLVIQQSRLGDGSRKVTYISEIDGIRGDQVVINHIFLYKQTGVDANNKVVGKFIATGHIPKFVEGLERKGIEIPKGLFSVG